MSKFQFDFPWKYAQKHHADSYIDPKLLKVGVVFGGIFPPAVPTKTILASVSVATAVAVTKTSRSTAITSRATITESFQRGNLACSTYITNSLDLGASGQEITTQIIHYHNSNTKHAERSLKAYNGLYDLEKARLEVRAEQSPLGWLVGKPPTVTLCPIDPPTVKTQPSTSKTKPPFLSINHSTNEKLGSFTRNNVEYFVTQPRPLAPILSKPHQPNGNFLASPIGFLALFVGVFSSFSLGSMIVNKIFNGTWVAKKPPTVLEILGELNEGTINQGQAGQLLENFSELTDVQRISILEGKKPGYEIITLEQSQPSSDVKKDPNSNTLGI